MRRYRHSFEEPLWRSVTSREELRAGPLGECRRDERMHQPCQRVQTEQTLFCKDNKKKDIFMRRDESSIYNTRR